MSKRQRASTGRYDPNAWFPVLKHALATGDIGWEQGYRYTLEQADGDLFWFRSARERDHFCKRHHLQIVSPAAMANVRKQYAFDLTKPWQPANRLQARKSSAITRRTVRATQSHPRRTILKFTHPVNVPLFWEALLAIPSLATSSQGRPAPIWDPLLSPLEPHRHRMDKQAYRLDRRVWNTQVDDFLIEAHLMSDHSRYQLDFRVIRKRSPQDICFDMAEPLYNGGNPYHGSIPRQVALEFTPFEHMHLTIELVKR